MSKAPHWTEDEYGRLYTAMGRSAESFRLPMPVFDAGVRQHHPEYWQHAAQQMPGRSWHGCRSKWVREKGRNPVPEINKEQLMLGLVPAEATPLGRQAVRSVAELAQSEHEKNAEISRLQSELDKLRGQLKVQKVTPIEVAKKSFEEQVVDAFNRIAATAGASRTRKVTGHLTKKIRALGKAIPAYKKLEHFEILFQKLARVPCLTKKFKTCHGRKKSKQEFFKAPLSWAIENPDRTRRILSGAYDNVRPGARFPFAIESASVIRDVTGRIVHI